jgi:hypothetical protein
MQQSQISDQQQASTSLEQRVTALEARLSETEQLQRRLLIILEDHFGQDIDGDGQIG